MKTFDGALNFDRIARIYRWAEWLTLGPLLSQTRRHFVPRLRHSRQALVIGDGDGRFLAHLMSQNPELRTHAIDISATMLGLLRARCEAASPTAANRLTTEQISAMHHTPTPETDLVVTHFFLDCLTQAQCDALAHKVAQNVQPGALWLVSDFAVPRTPVLRQLAAIYIRMLYAAFRTLTGLRVKRLPDPQAALTHAGFKLVARKQFAFGLLYTELWQLA